MAWKMRKNYQKKLNKEVRALNKNIATDNLWRGRFYFFQKEADWEQFSDNSGGMLHVIIRAYDKASGYYKDYRIEYAPWLTFRHYHIWKIANDFITEHCRVWSEDPRPSINDAKDWTKVTVDTQKIGKLDWNFHKRRVINGEI